MATNQDVRTHGDSGAEILGAVKLRIKLLVVASASAVALALGLSFYFALLSQGSSIAARVPELAPVAQKMTAILIGNTAAFAAVIILSFYLLSHLVTSRLFQPVASVERELAAVARGGISGGISTSGMGAFAGIERAFNDAASALRERERAEIEALRAALAKIASGRECADAVREIERIIASKTARLTSGSNQDAKRSSGGKGQAAEENDSIFMQPL